MSFELGCATEYEVLITTRDLETVVGEVPWSNISWSRVLDDLSEASVTVPDAFGGFRCNLESTDLIVPWRYGIKILRNNQPVWRGPITGIDRPARSGASDDFVEITANDKMAWLRKRNLPTAQTFTQEDAGTVFKGVIEDAMAVDNGVDLYCPQFETGFTMTRQIVPLDFEYAFDVIIELATSAVDFTVIDDKLVVEDASTGWFYQDTDHGKTRIAATTDPFGRYLLGMFTDEAYTTRPGYTIDGWSQGNAIYVPGADSGEAGFRRYWSADDVDVNDGVLVYVDVNPLYRPQPGTPIDAAGVFQQRADSLLALRNGPVVTVYGGSLSQQAPVTVDYLIPGSIWGMDLADEGISSLLTVQRLKRVDVTVTPGVNEIVDPTLIPLGTDESEGG